MWDDEDLRETGRQWEAVQRVTRYATATTLFPTDRNPRVYPAGFIKIVYKSTGTKKLQEMNPSSGHLHRHVAEMQGHAQTRGRSCRVRWRR
jgi:hypothetical protein